MPLTAGLFLAILLFQEESPVWMFIWIGLIGAICILYKITFIAPLAVTGICILVIAWLDRDQLGSSKKAFLRLVWMGIGVVVPLIAVGPYFASQGLWDRLILVFKMGSGYTKGSGMFPGLPPPFGFPIFWMSVNNAALLLFGLFGRYRCGRYAVPLRKIGAPTNLICVLWFIFSFAEAGIRRGGWEHYTLVVIPPLALMGAYEISVAYERWKNMKGDQQATLGAVAMSVLVILTFAITNFDFYRHYVSYKLGYISRRKFILGYTGTSGTGPAALNAEIIGEYLQAHTNPDDFIYLATDNVQSYYYADRKPSVGVLWPEYLFLLPHLINSLTHVQNTLSWTNLKI